MKKDKIFDILNGEKPKKSVLDAAYAELDASRAQKRPRNKLALKWATGILVPVLAVSVVIAVLNPFGGAKSSAPNDSMDAALPEYDKSATSQPIPFRFEYTTLSNPDFGSYSALYLSDQGESIGITILSAAPDKPTAATDITIEILGVTGFYTLEGGTVSLRVSYGGGHYLLTVEAETARLPEILSHIRLN